MRVNKKSFHYQLLDVTGLDFKFRKITICKYYFALMLRYILFLSFVYSSGILGLTISDGYHITSGPQAMSVSFALTYWIFLCMYFIIGFYGYIDNLKCDYITLVDDSDNQ